MPDFAEQARVALRSYLARGEEALAAEDIDLLLDRLQARTAAFHNFRVADHRALQEGHDLGSDTEMQQLWQKAQSLEGDLAQVITGARDEVRSGLTKVRKLKRSIGLYHSGQMRSPKFQHLA